jgi:hypothetical protein
MKPILAQPGALPARRSYSPKPEQVGNIPALGPALRQTEPPRPARAQPELARHAIALEHGSFLLKVSDDDERSLARSVVDDDGSQECIPSYHGRTTT